MRLRALTPSTADEIRPHLRRTREPLSDGLYVGRTHWTPFCRNLPLSMGYGWFKTTAPMRGEAERLKRGSVGSYGAGRFEGELVGVIAVGLSYGEWTRRHHGGEKATEPASFIYAADLLTAENRGCPAETLELEIVAAGVLRYLQGYDQNASAELQQRVDVAVQQERQDSEEALRWLRDGGPME